MGVLGHMKQVITNVTSYSLREMDLDQLVVVTIMMAQEQRIIQMEIQPKDLVMEQ